MSTYESGIGGGEGRLRRGFRLARLSWNVVEADRSLLLLPAAQLLAAVATFAVVFVPLFFISEEQNSSDLLLVGTGLASLPMNFINTFFGVAFIGVLRKHLAGEQATLSDGLAFARTRLGPIFRWSGWRSACSHASAAAPLPPGSRRR